MNIYFITYCAKLTEKSEDYGNVKGAYFNCWIDAIEEQKAKEIASNMISENNWEIENLEESKMLHDEFYDDQNEGKKYYEQAKIDGAVFMYHTW
ncbi:MAG: hypothetical protein K9H48_21015 [Melioribacteraceae bacterium]|nr:hypothetical protein [Saprospiraceae bacterium]MCF8356933.1 hypothetical protein [Melioribacteraceae bacterium]MCF8396330.1 hypothetical protein [Melioribacteraceae bacterium]